MDTLELDCRWENITRSIYTATTNSDELVPKLCNAYRFECIKLHTLNPSQNELYEEAQIWDLCNRLFTTNDAELLVSEEYELVPEILSQPLLRKVLKLKNWLEEIAGSYEPVSTNINANVYGYLRHGELLEAAGYLKQSGFGWKAIVLLGGSYELKNNRRKWKASIQRLLHSTDVDEHEKKWLGVLVGDANHVQVSDGADAVWIKCVCLLERCIEVSLARQQASDCSYEDLGKLFLGCRDPFLLLVKSVILKTPVKTPDQRLQLHVTLLLGTDEEADALLSSWIINRRFIWYTALLSSIDMAAQVIAQVLLMGHTNTERKKSVVQLQEYDLAQVLSCAANSVLQEVDIEEYRDLLYYIPIDDALGHILRHCRSILLSNYAWTDACSRLHDFVSTLHKTGITDPSVLEQVAVEHEPLVAEFAAYLHLCKVYLSYVELEALPRQSPGETDTKEGQFGAVSKFKARGQDALRSRLTSARDLLRTCAHALLSNEGAWNDPSVAGNAELARIKLRYTDVLKKLVE